MPVLVDGAGEVIARVEPLEVARQLGLTEVPVIVTKDWSDGPSAAIGSWMAEHGRRNS
jgi:hypothetical protein